MARVTDTGVDAQGLTGFTTLLQQVFRAALGQDLDVAAESPQGQIIGGLALILAQEEEALVGVSNGMDLYRSVGTQLDDLGSLLDIERRDERHSTVTVTLTGTPGTVIEEGARARTTAGAVFALTADATIGAGGTVSATMAAVDAGPVAAAAGTLTSIFDLVAGWTAVTNPAAASQGRRREPDVAYRARLVAERAKNARSSPEAIEAAVLGVDGVTACIVRNNPRTTQHTEQGVAIGERSFLTVVQGGSDAAVAAAIERAKPVGSVMTGAVAVDVPHPSGQHQTPVRFTRVVEVPLTVTIDITAGAGFPGNGTAQIIERVVKWAAGTWTSGVGDFDTSGLGVGDTLDLERIKSPILSVPGHVLESVAAVRKSNDGVVNPVLLTERLTIAAADVTVR